MTLTCPWCQRKTRSDLPHCDWCLKSFPQTPIGTEIEDSVCADIVKRQEKGIAKYGVTVAENPLPLHQWLQHAYEECLDQAIYLKRAMAEMEKPTTDGRL